MGMLARVCVVAVACLAVSAAEAENYPNKPIRVIVPFAAAGPTDIIARLVGQKLGETLGQQFYIENIPGAGGNTGTAMVAKSPHDGYTLLVVSTGFVVNPSLYAKVPYDPIKEFAPITLIADVPSALVVNVDWGPRTLAEALAKIKASPSKFNFATPGSGTTPHLTAENFFNIANKLNMTPIHYKGAGQAVGAVVGGEPKLGCMAITAPLQNIKGGRLKALAVSSAKRLPILPEVPTLSELGHPEMLDYTWVGAFLPAGTPATIQAKWYDALTKALTSADVKEKLQAMAFDALLESPAKTGDYVRGEISRWAQVVKHIGFKPE